MRNKYPGICYRCGKWCAKGDGHFEKRQGASWAVQHAACAIEHRNKKYAQVSYSLPRKRDPSTSDAGFYSNS